MTSAIQTDDRRATTEGRKRASSGDAAEESTRAKKRRRLLVAARAKPPLALVVQHARVRTLEVRGATRRRRRRVPGLGIKRMMVSD